MCAHAQEYIIKFIFIPIEQDSLPYSCEADINIWELADNNLFCLQNRARSRLSTKFIRASKF